MAAQQGIEVKDVVDAFTNNYGVALAGLIEVIAMAWFLNIVTELKTYANALSDIYIGAWWTFCATIVTPIVLGFMMVTSAMKDITDPYGGYPTAFLVAYGWGAAILVLVMGFLFSLKKWDDKMIESYQKEESSA